MANYTTLAITFPALAL